MYKHDTVSLYSCGYKDGCKFTKDELEPLINAAVITLKDNLHLCDGDVCTLKELRDAVAKINPNWDKD